MANFMFHTIESAPDASRDSLEEAAKTFGFLPNLLAGLAESPAALNGYLSVASAFASSTLTAAEQQIVLLTTSVFNGCGYCIAAHTMLAKMSELSESEVEALRSKGTLADHRFEALRRFTHEVVEKRGWVSAEEVERFLGAGFERGQVLEVVLGVTQKTLSNYVNHMICTEIDAPMQPFALESASALD